jgi:hypothetical protein
MLEKEISIGRLPCNLCLLMLRCLLALCAEFLEVELLFDGLLILRRVVVRILADAALES